MKKIREIREQLNSRLVDKNSKEYQRGFDLGYDHGYCEQDYIGDILCEYPLSPLDKNKVCICDFCQGYENGHDSGDYTIKIHMMQIIGYEDVGRYMRNG